MMGLMQMCRKCLTELVTENIPNLTFGSLCQGGGAAWGRGRVADFSGEGIAV
jgi:hypothetical protein